MDANPGGDRSPTGAAPRLDLVFYWVADLDRAVAFYRDLLGLPLMRRDGERWAEFDAGGRRVALHRAEDQPPSTGGGPGPVFPRGPGPPRGPPSPPRASA